MEVKDLAYEVDPQNVIAISKEIVYLHERELFEKYIYFKQTDSLSGDIIEILKRLQIQEEEHAYLLQIMLEKAQLQVKKYTPNELENIIERPINEALAYDIKEEKISADAYRDAIEKSSGKLKQVLEHILQEEFEHIGLLEKYLEEL
jgi:rubrerythrin